MDGVVDLLDGLTAAGVLLAIGSSAVRPNLDLTVDACGLDGRFAAIASLEDIDPRQARPAGLPGRRAQGGRRARAARSSSRTLPSGSRPRRPPGCAPWA